ncbi:hypothetical protein EVAR_76652_1 [Eumeta japonica]|uniref:Uncharacterized protein n=1 Tax=Eumeta variegata TaxID=151549 RepID=A0A4C1T669_EUMVA|nr:hypothetical protein EVAR_76652_1 [Eumeta japonica]
MWRRGGEDADNNAIKELSEENPRPVPRWRSSARQTRYAVQIARVERNGEVTAHTSAKMQLGSLSIERQVKSLVHAITLGEERLSSADSKLATTARGGLLLSEITTGKVAGHSSTRLTHIVEI